MLLSFPRPEYQSESSLVITTIANEGFLISTGRKKVLIDAMFKEGYGAYLVPAPECLQNMIDAEAPFAGVDVLLVTHADEDHFDPALTALFLLNNPNAQLVCPQQAFRLRREEKNFDLIKNRIHTAELELGSSAVLEIGIQEIQGISDKMSLTFSNWED